MGEKNRGSRDLADIALYNAEALTCLEWALDGHQAPGRLQEYALTIHSGAYRHPIIGGTLMAYHFISLHIPFQDLEARRSLLEAVSNVSKCLSEVVWEQCQAIWTISPLLFL